MQNGETNLEAGDRLAEVGHSHHLHWVGPAQQSLVKVLCSSQHSLLLHQSMLAISLASCIGV